MTDTRRQAAEEWMRDAFRAAFEGNFNSMIPTAMQAHEDGQECGEQRAVEGICKRLRYWQKELNVAFDYAADIENGGWKEEK